MKKVSTIVFLLFVLVSFIFCQSPFSNFNEKLPKKKIDQKFYKSLEKSKYEIGTNVNGFSRYGIMKNGISILLPIYNKITQSKNHLSYVICTLGNRKGIYNLNKEKWAIHPAYNRIVELDENLFFVQKVFEDGHFVKLSGKKACSTSAVSIDFLNDIPGVILIEKDTYNPDKPFGIFSIEKLKITNRFTENTKIVRTWSSDDRFILNRNGHESLENIQGKKFFKNKYTSIERINMSDMFIVMKNGLYGVVDVDENIITPLNYEKISQIGQHNNICLLKNRDGRYNFLTKEGEIIMDFDGIENYNRHVIIRKGEKYGVFYVFHKVEELVGIDKDEVIKTQDSKFWIFRKGNLYGSLDLYNNILTPAIYEKIDFRSKFLKFYTSKGLIKVINDKGKESDEGYLRISPIFNPKKHTLFNKKMVVYFFK